MHELFRSTGSPLVCNLDIPTRCAYFLSADSPHPPVTAVVTKVLHIKNRQEKMRASKKV